jgi:hypothetical protein
MDAHNSAPNPSDPLWSAEDEASGTRPLARVSHLMGVAGTGPEFALGSALLEAVRHVLHHELQAGLAAARAPAKSPWMTPPSAARVTRVPVKTIRTWAREGRIAKRLKNRCADPKQQKYLVNVDDVATVAEQVCTPAAVGVGGETVDLRDRARERAQQILAARSAKGR